MTSIRVPPLPYGTTDAPSVPRANPVATPIGPQFQALLKVQLKPSSSSPEPIASITQPGQDTDGPHGPNVEAMLQQLHACRKMLIQASSKAGRPAVGNSASRAAASDARLAAETLEEGTDTRCAGTHDSISRTDHVHDPAAHSPYLCESGFVHGVPRECPPQVSSAAQTLPVNIIIWIPVGVVRTRMQFARVRPRRRPGHVPARRVVVLLQADE